MDKFLQRKMKGLTTMITTKVSILKYPKNFSPLSPILARQVTLVLYLEWPHFWSNFDILPSIQVSY